MTLPTAAEITELFLYGPGGKPSDLLDSGIVRDVTDSETQIISKSDIMAPNGPGRFALGANMTVVDLFLNGDGCGLIDTLAPGSNSKIEAHC